MEDENKSNCSLLGKQYKDCLLQTMKGFVDFCDQNNLDYVAAYGTVLGAVRHKGLIPWDDDIDVFMTRENYEKFISCKEKARGQGYEILDLNDPGYYLPFAKFCNANTTLWEDKRVPFVIGVFIDIFPLDYTSKDDRISIDARKRYKKLWGRYYQSLGKYEIRELVSPHLLKKFFKSLLFSLILKQNDVVKFEEEIKKIRGPYRMSYGAIYSYERSKFRNEWFEDCVKVPFEDMLIRIPRDYDGFLKMCYGEYMKLPPEEKRVSEHKHYFVDLERRLTIEDIKKIKNGK